MKIRSQSLSISSVHTYAELRQQIHNDLRTQHPEWIEPNGESPMCDSYETRLMETLATLMRRELDDSIASPQLRELAV